MSKSFKHIFHRRRRDVVEKTWLNPRASERTLGRTPKPAPAPATRPHEVPSSVIEASNQSPVLFDAQEPEGSHYPGSLTAPRTSLWDRAYEELEKEDPELLRKYENILLKEAGEHNGGYTQQSAGDPSTADGTTPTDARRIILEATIKRCRERAENDQSQYTIFGRIFDPRTQVAQASELLMKLNGLISEAVKASPEASLAWAGTSIILPLLTNPMTAKDERSNGLTYVTARSKFYVQLEPHLWPAQFQQPQLREEFQSHIIQLYHRISEFQIKAVVQYHNAWVKRVSKDALLWEDWKSMIAKIQELETNLREESKIVYTAAGYDLITETLEAAVNQNRKLDEQMQVLYQQLKVGTEHLRVNRGILATSQEAKRIMQRLDLPTVPEAWHDSHEFDTRAKCWPGTRERVVSDLVKWTEGDSTKSMLWLNGPMGTGKSTVAITVTKKLLRDGRLLASFFFLKRGGTERNRLSRLFPTLAQQMAIAIPQFRDALQKTLDGLSKEEIEIKSLEWQFETLIMTPLKVVDTARLGSLRNVLIIDALDECDELACVDKEPDDRLLDILHWLSKLGNSGIPPLRIILTSRSDPHVRKAIRLRSLIQPLDLDSRDLLDETKVDVGTFIRGKLNRIAERRNFRSWPAPADIERLIESANKPEPLFIYAATFFLFIEGKPEQPVNPKKQLSKWLAETAASTSRLGQIYKPVLDRALGSPEHEDYDVDEHKQLVLFLGALCLFEWPMTQEAVARLLRFHPDDVGHWIASLHAVLDIDDMEKTIRLRHKSFNDFLLQSTSAEYYVDATQTHTELAQLCISRMQDSLKRDICSVRKLDIIGEDIKDDLVEAHIPDELNYACRYWVHHLVRGNGRSLVNAWEFLEEHFLHWLEAMSLLSRVSEAVQAVAALLDLSQECEAPISELVVFLEEAMMILSKSSHVIQKFPLQTYSSILLFLPLSSTIRRMFWSRRLPPTSNVQGIDTNWGGQEKVLGHSRIVWSFVISPCGQLLASHEVHGSIRIWSVRTGALQRVFETNEGYEYAQTSRVAFSPCSRYLSVASDGMVGVCDLQSGDDTTTSMEGVPERSSPVNMSFVKNGKFTVAYENGTICTWNVGLKTEPRTTQLLDQFLFGRSSKGDCMVASPDGRLLATSREADDWAVHLWDVASGRRVHKMHELHSEFALDERPQLCFSKDCTLLASRTRYGNGSLRIYVWNTDTGDIRHVLRCRNQGHMRRTGPVFSPDSQTLAATCGDFRVQLWQVATGKPRIWFQTSHPVNKIAWSLDGRLLAASTYTGPVHLWDVQTGQLWRLPIDDRLKDSRFSTDGRIFIWARATNIHLFDLKMFMQSGEVPHEPHSGSVSMLACSRYGQVIASASREGGPIVIWDAAQWSIRLRIKRSTEVVEALALSPDGSRLAAAIRDTTSRSLKLQILCTSTSKVYNSIVKTDHLEISAIHYHTRICITALVSNPAQASLMLWQWNPMASAERIISLGSDLQSLVFGASFSPSGFVVAIPDSHFAPDAVALLATDTGDCLDALDYKGAEVTFDQQCGLRLTTPYGVLPIHRDSPAGTILATHDCSCEHCVGNCNQGWTLQERWIHHNGQPSIMLPPGFVAHSQVVHGSTLFIGTGNGRVIRVSDVEDKDFDIAKRLAFELKMAFPVTLL